MYPLGFLQFISNDADKNKRKLIIKLLKIAWKYLNSMRDAIDCEIKRQREGFVK